MIFFTALIFIAEIIIATAIIAVIVKFSYRVNNLNSKLLLSRYDIIQILNTFKKTVNDFYQVIEISEKEFVKKRKKIIVDLIKASVLTILFIALSKKYKKQIILFELILILYDSYNEGCIT